MYYIYIYITNITKIKARAVFERGAEFFGDEFCDEKFYIAYAEFEESCHDHDRARAIYKYAVQKLGMCNKYEGAQN